jgi:hypothetical protein
MPFSCKKGIFPFPLSTAQLTSAYCYNKECAANNKLFVVLPLWNYFVQSDMEGDKDGKRGDGDSGGKMEIQI